MQGDDSGNRRDKRKEQQHPNDIRIIYNSVEERADGLIITFEKTKEMSIVDV